MALSFRSAFIFDCFSSSAARDSWGKNGGKEGREEGSGCRKEGRKEAGVKRKGGRKGAVVSNATTADATDYGESFI